MGDQSQPTQFVPHNSVQAVTSVGNSWIICRSKSHAGRIYYFNTLSGEAAWNLSDQEIEKAKTRTKFLESQSGGKFEGCPEPKDPPVEPNDRAKTSQIFVPSRVYNKQIINNQFTKPALAPVDATQCSKCSSATTMDTMGITFPSTHNCNPNVWAVPPNHQIVIQPKTSPILNQFGTSANMPSSYIEQRVSVQNTSLPLSHRFNQLQGHHTPKMNLQFSNGFNKTNNIGQRNSSTPYYRKFNRFPDSMDLRQRLTARRKSNNNWNNIENSSYNSEDVGPNDTQKIQIIKPTIENITPSDADDQWLKENASFEGKQPILNVTPLKLLVTSDNSTWYIVADNSVLLNHINLMNVLVNSDEQCQLMVPDFLMASLQYKSRSNDPQLLSRAHHILQILSQQFTAGNAVMGKDPTSYCNIHDFCIKLSTQGHDVVLISDNVQWKSHKMNSIFVFNVQELKDLLTNAEKPSKQLIDDLSIQITIPNNTNIYKDEVDTKPTSVGILYNGTSNEFNGTSNEITKSEAHINRNGKKHEASVPKRSIDFGTQTDFNDAKKTFSPKFNLMEVNINSHINNFNEKQSELLRDRYMVDSEQVPKRKEIRLRRNLSHQPSTDTNTEKRQFKWRRKRNSSIHNANIDQRATLYNGSTPTMNENISAPESRSSCYEPGDSSETSSTCFIAQSVDGKIVIEETSTSGIISNSADSESMQSIKVDEQMYSTVIHDGTDACKCVMFEVETSVMQENLEMRCDEWVSRFVQIMEEVLTQILQQAPVFCNETLPPPWTIHEATECIKEKFESDADIKDAAHRLTNVLFKISDGRGKISVDLNPNDFMEMYSYGVYLIDSLQSILSNSEDLQTAADSLAKLLSDIQDPHLDTSHTDAFMDNTHVPPTDVTEIITSPIHKVEGNEPKPEENASPKRKSPPPSINIDEKKYNLRSSQKKTTEDEAPTEQPVKFIRNINIESTFFSSLRLKKNQEEAENMATLNQPSSLDTPKDDQNKIPQSFNNIESQNNAVTVNDTPRDEPKIIRNFSKCLEFEDKLKNKDKEPMEVSTMDYSHNTHADDGDGYYDDNAQYDYGFYENEEEMNDLEVYDDKENDIMDSTIDKNSKIDLDSLVRRIGMTTVIKNY